MRKSIKFNEWCTIASLVLGLLLLIWNSFSAWAQETSAENRPFKEVIVVKKVLIGPHPDYSRVMIQLSDPAEYEIKADFMKRLVTLTLNKAILGPEARSRTFKDRNLEKVNLNQRQNADIVDIDIKLKNRNSRFFHFLKDSPDLIVVDVKGTRKPFAKSRFKLPRKEPLKVAGFSQADIQQAVIKNQESNLKNGRQDYNNALKKFQEKKYEEAIKLFQKFQDRYPRSIYSETIAFLKAQAEFNIAFKKKRPVYDKALNSYNYAVRQFPKSKFAEHAKTRLAFIYDQMNMVLEAKTLYEQRLREDPKGPFSPFVQEQLSLLLLKQNRYEEALEALSKVLKMIPDSTEARRGFYKIGKWYYDQQEFPKAIKIFEFIEKQAKEEKRRGPQERFWQALIAENPEMNFFMAEMYFREQDLEKGRDHYFALLNLSPENPAASRARNRIGDSYFMEKNDSAALAVFDESAKLDRNEREAQYGLIRMADIGVRNPNLKVKGIALNTKPYFHPFKTYQEVIQNAKDKSIIAEALLSRGIAYLRNRRYLEASEQFKRLLKDMNPEPNLVQAGEKYLKQSLIFLVDKISRQEGKLPILYAYGDFLAMNLGDIHNVKTLLQVGEAYQSIGMFQQAVGLYEKVKRFDTRGTFSDRIFLNLGRIHLAQGNPENAERVGKTFVSKFSRSRSLPSALELIGDSLNNQGKKKEAIAVYEDLLKRETVDPSGIHYKIALIREDQGKLDLAAESFRKVLDTYDRNARPIPEQASKSHYRLGGVLYKNKSYPQAISALKTARELFPNHDSRNWADYLIAQAYSETQDENQASTEMEGIAKSDQPDDLLKEVAKTNLKLKDWEKQFKDVL